MITYWTAKRWKIDAVSVERTETLVGGLLQRTQILQVKAVRKTFAVISSDFFTMLLLVTLNPIKIQTRS